MVKINGNCCGFGGLDRDAIGEVLAAFSSNYSSILILSIAEAMTLRKTMIITKELGFSNVLFEGDCLPIVLATTNQSPLYDALFSIIFDIHILLDSKLN